MFSELKKASQIHRAPDVYSIDNFISADECQHIVNLAKPHLQPAVVSSASSGVKSSGRTGSVHWIKHDTTPTVQTIVDKISHFVEMPSLHAESLQVIYYSESQQYKPHFDAYDLDSAAGKRCTANGGQRLLTALLYLNDVIGGGETVFPKINQSVVPQMGRMLVFKNCYEGTNKRHPNSLHGGEPVESGEKWACNLWFRERTRG